MPTLPAPVVTVDPLFPDPDDAQRIVELAHRFGRYRIYGEAEQVDLDLGRGLLPRQDSVQHFLRTGGARGPGAGVGVGTLASRTSYFREEYAYDGQEHLGGVDGFLHNPALIDAAVTLFDRPVVEPAIAFANLMLPGQELAVHTDVPEFRGVSRKNLPQWLLVVMHHSGLFDAWRLSIATGISYFQDSDSGALRYWPDGPDAAPARLPVRANTAVVLDTDSVFHGVDPVGHDVEAPRLAAGATLAAGPDGAWTLVRPRRRGDGRVRLGRPPVLGLVEGLLLRRRGRPRRLARPAATTSPSTPSSSASWPTSPTAGWSSRRVARDPDLGRLLIDTYVRFPATA